MIDDKNPLITVIIPTYNSAATLRRAILSVIKQTHPDFELIIVDDCSTDNTEATVRQFNDKRITYVRHLENKGCAAGRNTGMSKAQGSLLAFLDSDDEFLPEKLERVSKMFQCLSKDTAMIITNLTTSNTQGQVYVSKQLNSEYVLSSTFPGSVFSVASSWMLRKDCMDQIGLFDEMVGTIEDADYFARVLDKFRIYYFNQALSVKHDSFERKGYLSDKHFLGRELFCRSTLQK
jgi:glycosyltransferase involved in cell wall biosynthesis